jgi:site-specific DNA recombinase
MVGSDTPEGFFMEHILVGMAEFYSRNLSREIMKGLKQRATNGHLFFRPPYGYRQEIIERQQGHKRTQTISRPVIDEKAAPVVRRVFELYDQALGYKSHVFKMGPGRLCCAAGEQGEARGRRAWADPGPDP